MKAPAWQRILRVVATVLAVLSPFVLYAALSSGRTREGTAVILVWVILRTASSTFGTDRAHMMAVLRLPALGFLSAAAGLVTNDERFLLLLPSLTQGSFAAVFLASLRGTPLVEHFARMQKPNLSPAQIRYCRTVTIVWGVVLSCSVVVGIALAFTASLATWTAFTGVGGYAIVAALFSVEYVVRKIRFREYGRHPLDRVLVQIFPPHTR